MRLLLLAGLFGILCAPGGCERGPYQLTTPFARLSGEGLQISELCLDGSGQGLYGRNLVRSLAFDNLGTTPGCQWSRAGEEITITGLELRLPREIKVETTGLAEQLTGKQSLGQSFKVAEGSFEAVEALLPTWATTDSAATLELRRDGPGGPLVASRRMTNMPDNFWQRLTFPPQGPGTYYLEINSPVNTPGWWGTDKDVYPDGTAFVDGRPVPERDRSFRLTARVPGGPARLRIAAAGPQISLTAELLPGAQPRDLPLVMKLPWDNTGYDVSARAVPFRRFFTDNQRYLPAEQFKRAENPGLGFGPCAWMEADGTSPADLRFSGDGLSINWSATADTMAMTVAPRGVPGAEGVRASAVTMTVLPRADRLPADWPRFETPDRLLTEDLNRLFYERNFSWPGPAGPAPWYEFEAICRDWFSGPLHEGEAANLRGGILSPEGYVYTWGGSPGWPFPDNSKYDTRHFDTNARFILGCWRHVCWTHDLAFLRSQAERLRRAMSYQLTTLQGQEGLIVCASKDLTGRHQTLGDNYWDILPFGHLDAYANILYYASLEAMAQLETLMAQLPDLTTPTPARSPGYYRELDRKVRAAYNKTFWDDAQGRYIGCVDVDGKRHDYGFTFIATEAMAYGLADEGQAQRMYQWMEHGTSSTGQADIYSKWRFAPRATTIHNPMWDEHGVNDPHADGVQPWWHFGWRGTPFGDQCQDGGAIFYCSYYDLMARTRLLGPERAWERWEEILARYREPDRLCGGPPLYRGENPQQANPGSVGLDIPFPESGLVPNWFLYGVAGVQATAEGLLISPRLPKALPWLTVRNLTYRGLTMDLRVTNRLVRLTCNQPGRRFVWARRITPGGQALFAAPPPPLTAFPDAPQVAR